MLQGPLAWSSCASQLEEQHLADAVWAELPDLRGALALALLKILKIEEYLDLSVLGKGLGVSTHRVPVGEVEEDMYVELQGNVHS
jgi:hypothetical protein